MPAMMSPAARCRHCGQRKRSRSRRGLCRTCHDTPAVRALYPGRDTGRGRPCPARGNKSPNAKGLAPRLPCEPTDAEPGTEEKIRVLAERLRLRQQLWHPLDAKLPAGRSAIRAGVERRVTGSPDDDSDDDSGV